MKDLYNLVQSINPMPETFWQELQNLVKETTHLKKQLILMEGEVCREIHFIINGLARAYYYKNGEEITSWIMKENDLIVSVRSFYSQNPSYENIEFLENSTVISLKYDLLQTLYNKYPEFNFVARVLTERYYLLSEERTYSLRMQSAKERFEILLSTHPEYFQRVPLKYISSYLGMAPETLSRMRTK